MDELLKLLVSADTAMVGVTFIACQVIKRFLPSKPDGGAWSVADRWGAIPFAAAFFLGAGLSIALVDKAGITLIGKVRGGLQTGAYSVVIWELWSNSKKIFGGGA